MQGLVQQCLEPNTSLRNPFQQSYLIPYIEIAETSNSLLGSMTEIIPQRRSRTVYLLKKPLECLRRIPGIRSLRLAQHWAIQVGEDGDIWALERLSKQEIRLKKSERTEWEDAAKRWPKETIGTTDTNDTEIESVGECPTSRRPLLPHTTY